MDESLLVAFTVLDEELQQLSESLALTKLDECFHWVQAME